MLVPRSRSGNQPLRAKRSGRLGSHHPLEIDKARLDLAQLATERPHTITIDWQAVLDQHPEYVDNDGIHLPTPSTWEQDIEATSRDQLLPVDQAAACARQEFY